MNKRHERRPSRTSTSQIRCAVAVVLVTTTFVLPLSCTAPAADEPVDSAIGADRPAAGTGGVTGSVPHALADAPGFVVWESNRSGHWRLWRRQLTATSSGQPPRAEQLTEDESGRRHCCPHISPDGSRLVYLSLPAGPPKYPKGGQLGELRLVDLVTGTERRLAATARTYFEHRAAGWHDADSIVYIAGDGRTQKLDLATDTSAPLTTEALDEYGYLINRTLTHATTGRPVFAPYDTEHLQVAERPSRGGCQPYFSYDGRWGFWTAGVGGPLKKIELTSGDIGTIVRKNDDRLPADLGYLYFPMLSTDGRLFAFAASADEHDHFTSDYEVFVAETDPETLELVGDPVRITTHPATDRFPDVFAEPLPLGSHRGEAPLTVVLEPPDRGEWRWSFGQGHELQSAARVEHRYDEPGLYSIEARRGERRLLGRVRVAAAAAPRVQSVELRDGGNELLVRFDEPILVDRAALTLESGIAIHSQAAGSERELVVTPAQPIVRPDTARLTGVTDHNGRPMEPVSVAVEPPLWPARRDGLRFVWQTADAPNLIPDEQAGADRAILLEPRGRARADRQFAMIVDGGQFVATDDEGNRLRWALQASNELTLELTLTPRAADGALVTFGRRDRENFTLFLDDGKLIWRQYQRTLGQPARAVAELVELVPERPNHLVLTYSPSELDVYLDGEPVAHSAAVRSDFFHWRSLPLAFGDRQGRSQATIEGIAIYDRVLGAAEVRENATRYATLRERRPPVTRWLVEARLIKRTPRPSLDEISPYREALAVSLYEVERWLEGPDEALPGEARLPRQLRVVEWAIQDAKPVERSSGTSRLTLEPFSAQPQLASLYLGDAIAGGEGELWYSID